MQMRLYSCLCRDFLQLSYYLLSLDMFTSTAAWSSVPASKTTVISQPVKLLNILIFIGWYKLDWRNQLQCHLSQWNYFRFTPVRMKKIWPKAFKIHISVFQSCHCVRLLVNLEEQATKVGILSLTPDQSNLTQVSTCPELKLVCQNRV